MPTSKNIKTQAATARPVSSGWAPQSSQGRILSQLDAATGRLTGDQAQYYADLPSEEFSPQPSPMHKIIQTADGAAEYHQLVAAHGSWHDPATGNIYTNAIGRP